MLKYRKSSRDHDFLKSSLVIPLWSWGVVFLEGSRGEAYLIGGGLILFSEDGGINSRHKELKQK